MSKKQNITVGIDIEAKIDSAQKSITALQKNFAKLNLSDAMQAEFSNLFASIDKELNKIAQKTASGKINIVDAASVEKSFEKIEALYTTLNKKIASRGIAKAGLKEDSVALNAITNAAKICEKATEDNAKQQERLSKALDVEKTKRAELLEKQKLQKTVSEEEILNQKLKLDNAKKLEKAAKKELEQAKAALDAKIAASNGKYTEADIGKKGSALRKTDAFKVYREAASKYSAASTSVDTDNKALKSMVTPAMQAEELKKIEDAIASADEKLREFNETSSKSNLGEALEKAKKALEELEVDFSSYDIDIKDIKDINDLRAALEKIKDVSGKKINTNLKQIADGVDTIENACEGAAGEVKAVSNELVALDDRAQQTAAFQNRIKDFLGLSGAAQVLRSSLRNAMQTITDLDATMTEMAVVTDLGVSDYWKQLPEYTARAKDLGLAIGDVYKADTLFYQQGLKTNEVVEISTETMKMAAIAGLDTAVATDRMTAALRGFNMELNETSAQKVSDVYSELAAITAADVDEISNAMTKTASIASSAGMEFETTAAFLSQIIETTRESAETAGTAMKTIIARFQELKKAPGEIGEVEGEVVDANKIETALRTVGVALRDSSGQFRELDEVFLELSSKWDGLDKNTQRYIATIAAGSRQQSRFIAMMSDYGRTQELVTAANTSAGASQKQFEKTTESLEYKINNLKAAWDEFTMGIMNSELVKTGVDILTKLLEIVNKTTSALDGVGGSLTKIISIAALFKLGKNLFDKFANPITNFFLDLTKKAYQAGQDSATAYMQGGKDAVNGNNANTTNKKNTDEPLRTGYSRDKNNRVHGPDGKFATEDEAKRTGWEKFGDKTIGLNKYQEAGKYGKERQKALNDLKKAKKGSEEYEQAQKSALENGEKQWKAYGQAVAQTGMAITGAGVAISMLGTALESAGLGEQAEWITQMGNGITIVGGAMSSLGPVITGIVAKLVDGGMSAAAAWGWIAAVAAIVAAIGIAVVGIAKAVNEASPEKKLKKAREEADAATEAADKLNESYQNLKSSLNSLEHAQDTLDGLVNGTDAWREAVEKVNNQVLELIQQYPELAEFVEHNNGVMTIDMDDSGVQAALERAKQNALNANIVAQGAEINALQAQNDANYDSLSRKAKINYADPETAAGVATGATYAANIGSATAIGAKIGTLIAPGPGTAIGAGVGALAAAITTAVTGDADIFAEAATEHAEAYNDRTQSTVEGIARALASGKLVDTGSGYERAENVTDSELLDLGVAKNFNDFYGSLGDSTDELKKFGAELNKTAEQAETYYNSMAIQILNGMDQSGWSKSAQAIADNVLDGSTLEGRREKIAEDLEDVDFLDKNLSSNLESRMANAIQDVYGAGSALQKGENGYEIVDSAGEVKMSNVTSDALRNIVATQEAKEETEGLGYVMKDVPQELMKGFKKYLGDDVNLDEKAITALLDDENGTGLTQAQQEMFDKLSDEALTDIFNSSDELTKTFGIVDNFIDKIRKPIRTAGDAFNQSAKVFNKINNDALKLSLSKLTSGQQFGLSQKLDSVYEKGTVDEIAAVESSLSKVLSGENADEIAEYLSASNFDWTDQEHLNKAKADLIEKYDVEATAADKLVASLGNAVDATSDLTVLDDVFGRFHQASQRVAVALEKVSDLQWEYERMLNQGTDALKLQGNLEEQRKQLLEAGNNAIESYKAAREQQNATYALGVSWNGLDIDLTKSVKFDPKTGMYDYSGLSEVMQREGYTRDTENGKKILDYQKALDEANENAKKQIDIAKDSYEKLEDLEEAAKNSYSDLWNQIGETLLASMEKAIETQEGILDATKTANDKLIDKIQEQIDADRQARENQEAEDNINDMRSKMVYLGMDTSGANELSILELEKQIAEAEQDYQDSLIDQSIQSLQDANEKAFEQRERQITIAEQQLDAYKNSSEHQDKIQETLNQYMTEYKEVIEKEKAWATRDMTRDEFEKEFGKVTDAQFQAYTELGKTMNEEPAFKPEDTALGRLMVQNGILDGMSELDREGFWDVLEENTANAATHIESLKRYSKGEDGEKDGQKQLLDEIRNNTAIKELTDVLWAGEVSAANEKERLFGEKMGEGGFKPNVVKDTVEEYNGNTSLMEQHAAFANNTYSDANTNALIESDNTEVEGFSSIQEFSSSTEGIGGEVKTEENGKVKVEALSALSKKDFYNRINNGQTIYISQHDKNGKYIGDKIFNAQTLLNSLNTGERDKDSNAFIGSYEDYQRTVVNSVLGEKELGADGSIQEQIKKQALNYMNDLIASGDFSSLGAMLDSEDFKNIMNSWDQVGKTRKDMGDYLVQFINEEDIPNPTSVQSQLDGFYSRGAFLGEGTEIHAWSVPPEACKALDKSGAVMYQGKLYWKDYGDGLPSMIRGYYGRTAYFQKDITGFDFYKNTLENYKKYKTGGLADFTGPAWLDGTPSKPEYILNAAQTERFFSLIDVLEGYDKDKETKKTSGDNYFDIEINVEKLENDYDVEQVADKIRRMIYEDATYRNVNAINYIR